MMTFGRLAILGWLCVASAAQAQSVITTTVSPDQKTITTTSSAGTVTTESSQTAFGTIVA